MIKKLFNFGVILMIFSAIGLVCIWVVLAINDQFGDFEYITSSGESGTASFCGVSYGQARCRTDDNTTIMVERFTKK